MTEPTLRDWNAIPANQPSKELLYHDAFWEQMKFARDILPQLLARNGDEYRTMVKVISTHVSKSVTLPVYYIDLPEHRVSFYMRDNFYNWNVSVSAALPIRCNFLDCFDDSGGYVFCEGMEGYKFGRYADNPSRFTVCMNTKYDVWTFFRVLRQHLGIKVME